MNGLYNIAVADIGEIASDGQVRPSADGSAISQSVTVALQSTFQNNPNILVWSNTSELRLKRVRIGTLEGNSSQELTQAAANLAQRLNADMIIHGTIDRRQQPPLLSIQMYLAPKLGDALDEIKGNFPLDAPIALNSDLDSDVVQKEIARQTNLLANLALAQAESKSGRTVEALEGYLKAGESAPESDMLQFFIGRESLFVIEREAIPQTADAAFEEQARTALEKALQLNPQNARAYVGLGTLYLKQAKRLINEAMNSEYTDQTFQQITQLLDQATSVYGHALELKVDPAGYGVPIEDIARLGEADVQITRGLALLGYTNYDTVNEAFHQAAGLFDQAIQTLNETLPAFQTPGLSRYLAQNYQFLGSAYQTSGYLAYLKSDPSAARQDYQKAIEQFDACIALGENTTDRVIREEIVEANCQPERQRTEELMQLLSGGS
jgi:TPR repeat protein